MLNISLAMRQLNRKSFKFPGDNNEEVPPVPISNTAVKLFNVDGTDLAASWKSRKSPGFNIKKRTLI